MLSTHRIIGYVRNKGRCVSRLEAISSKEPDNFYAFPNLDNARFLYVWYVCLCVSVV